jgi:hypothetical protein
MSFPAGETARQWPGSYFSWNKSLTYSLGAYLNSSNTNFTDLHARGIEGITSIYGTLWPRIFSTFGPYRPQMGAHELAIVYGLYLSDFSILSALETELTVYTSIQCQGHRGPSLWHVRGLGRVLGARGSDDENDKIRRIKDVLRGIKVAVMKAVEFCGPEMVQRSRLDGGPDGLQGWPNVGDVKRELGGWGDDDLLEPQQKST